MSKLTLAEVENIAHLARLSLTVDEKTMLQDQLSAVLEYAEMLNELDTENVPPTTSALPLDNVMRADEVQPSLPPEKTLANAPVVEDNSFKVKPIL